MTPLEDFFTALGAKLDRVHAAKCCADLHESPDFSVFRYIKPNENCLSDILADLLDPLGPHGQGTLFLEQFLRIVRLDLGNPLDGTRVVREDTTTCLFQNRRIDFTVEVGLFGVGVENKPWASDQPEQVSDYIQHLEKKYDCKGYCMVYLAGEGHPPQSLGKEERERLEREGRFRTIPYSGERSLRTWLESCHGRCHSVRVRVFIEDFIRFIDGQFGTGTQDKGKKDMQTEVVVEHAMSAETNLALFLDAVKAFNAVANRIISEFTQALAGQLAAELKPGDGWLVKDDSPGGEGEELGETVAIRKEGWPGGPAWKESLRVALAYDHPKPCAVYFSARRQPRLLRDIEADRIAEVLSKQHGPGKRDGAWWPYWYRYESMLTNWADPDVLLKLRRKDTVDHFVGRMLKMAKAVDSALATVS